MHHASLDVRKTFPSVQVEKDREVLAYASLLHLLKEQPNKRRIFPIAKHFSVFAIVAIPFLLFDHEIIVCLPTRGHSIATQYIGSENRSSVGDTYAFCTYDSNHAV